MTGSRPVVAVNALGANDSAAGSRTMLARLLPALADVAPELELLLICNRDNPRFEGLDAETIVIDVGERQTFRRIVQDLYHVPKLIKGRADVLVTPTGVGPFRSPVPQVGIVSAHLVLPSCRRAVAPARMPLLKRAYLGWPVRHYLRRADAVLGISDFVARGIVEELKIDAAKVGSMPLGVDDPPTAPNLRGRLPLVLFVGTLYPYKDGDTAIRSFAAARDQLPEGARLVIVGRDYKDQSSVLRALAESCGIGDAVEVKGPVSQDELEQLFATAGVLLMSSRCEGFGLPVAEAMSRGLPVVAADATSLPGVAGDAAILVEPGDVAGFARALVAVLSQSDLRNELARRGIERSRELTWEAAAGCLASAIHGVLDPSASSGQVAAARRSDHGRPTTDRPGS